MILRAFGHAASTTGARELTLDISALTVEDLLAHLNSLVEDGDLKISMETVLIAIDGVEISALSGSRTVVNEENTVSLIPVSHGG